MNNKIGIGILGGLGDVSLLRKNLALITTDLNKVFEIVALADVYEHGRIRNPAEIEKVFDEIKTYRIKGTLDSRVEAALKNDLVSGKIKYFQLDRNNPELPQEFLEMSEAIDISVPNKLHVPLTKQILARTGKEKSLMIEKPVASCANDLMDLEQSLPFMNLEGRIAMDAEHYSHYGHIAYFIANFEQFSKNSGNGFGLGKIKGLDISIEENEDFSSQRNQEIIEISKSGGGIWVDTGIHTMGFLRNIGANIDNDTIIAARYKSHDPFIQDSKYAETAMEVELEIREDEFYEKGCKAKISVGKSCSSKNKKFIATYENGAVEMNVADKSLKVIKNGAIRFYATFPDDAFYNVLDEFGKCIRGGIYPSTTIDKGMLNVKDLLITYSKAGPIIQLTPRAHKYSQIPN